MKSFSTAIIKEDNKEKTFHVTLNKKQLFKHEMVS